MSPVDRIRDAIEAIHYPRVGIDIDGQQYLSCANCEMTEDRWPCLTVAAMNAALADSPADSCKDVRDFGELGVWEFDPPRQVSKTGPSLADLGMPDPDEDGSS